jgi:hypothetical protein
MLVCELTVAPARERTKSNTQVFIVRALLSCDRYFSLQDFGTVTRYE